MVLLGFSEVHPTTIVMLFGNRKQRLTCESDLVESGTRRSNFVLLIRGIVQSPTGGCLLKDPLYSYQTALNALPSKDSHNYRRALEHSPNLAPQRSTI